jgi:hypothetical protein
MKSTTLPWFVKAALGVLFIIGAFAAIGIDLFNAYLYGLTVAKTMAALAVLVAIFVPIIPIAIACGFPRSLWLLEVVCIAAVMYFSYQYYGVSLRNNNVALTTAHEVYTTAAEEKKLAMETLTRIKEHGDIEELGKLANNADAHLVEAGANVAKYCKGRRETDDCTQARKTKTLADTAATLAHNKLSDSKAWHEAKETLAKANATQTKGDANAIEADLPATLASLLLVQFLAALSGVGATGLVEALAERAALKAVKNKAPRKIVTAPTDGGTEQTLPEGVVSITAARWLENRTVRGGEMQGGAAKKNFERFTGQKISAAQFRAAMVALVGDAVEPRNSGFVIKGYELKVLAKSPQEKQSAII